MTTNELIACEQALLFGRVHETSLARMRERAAKPRGAEESSSGPRSHVLARLASLAQIGELARRLMNSVQVTQNEQYCGQQNTISRSVMECKDLVKYLGVERSDFAKYLLTFLSLHR